MAAVTVAAKIRRRDIAFPPRPWLAEGVSARNTRSAHKTVPRTSLRQPFQQTNVSAAFAQLCRRLSMTPDEKLAALGLTLPPPPSPLANYVPIRRDGDTVYLAGQGPRLPDGSMR